MTSPSTSAINTLTFTLQRDRTFSTGLNSECAFLMWHTLKNTLQSSIYVNCKCLQNVKAKIKYDKKNFKKKSMKKGQSSKIH